MSNTIPVANLEVFLDNPSSEAALAECHKVAESFIVSERGQRRTAVTRKGGAEVLDLVMIRTRAL